MCNCGNVDTSTNNQSSYICKVCGEVNIKDK